MVLCSYKHAGCTKVIPANSNKKICPNCQRHVDLLKERKKKNAPEGTKICNRHRTGCLKFIPLDGPKSCANCIELTKSELQTRGKWQKAPAPQGFRHCAAGFVGCEKLVALGGLTSCQPCLDRGAISSKKRRLDLALNAPPAKRLCTVYGKGCEKYIDENSAKKSCQTCLDKTKEAWKNQKEKAPEGKKLCLQGYKGCVKWIPKDGMSLCDTCYATNKERTKPKYLKNKSESELIEHYFEIRKTALGGRSRDDVDAVANKFVKEGIALFESRTKGELGWKLYVGVGSIVDGTNYTSRQFKHPDFQYFDAIKASTDLLALGLAEIKFFFSIASKYGIESLQQRISNLGLVRMDCKSGKAVLYLCSHPPHLNYVQHKPLMDKLAKTVEKNRLTEKECIDKFKSRYKNPLANLDFKKLLAESEELATQGFVKHLERVDAEKEKGRKIETYVGVGTCGEKDSTHRLRRHGIDWDFRDVFPPCERFVGGLAEIKLAHKIIGYQPNIHNHTSSLGQVPWSGTDRKYQLYLLNKIKTDKEEDDKKKEENAEEENEIKEKEVYMGESIEISSDDD